MTNESSRLPSAAFTAYAAWSVTGSFLCSELEDGAATPGTRVVVETYDKALPVPNKHRLTARGWHFEDMGRGFQRLISEASDLALDNPYGSLEPGTNLIGWSPNGFSPQNWRLERQP